MDSCVENLNDIYTLLYSKGLIPHPFIEDNELRLSWVDSSTWTYATSFHIAQSDLEKNSIKLRAANIDTYSKVYINNELIGNTNNEFITYSFDIKPFVQLGDNALRIEIEPALNYLNYNSDDYSTLESEKRVISRKAQYRYGWDWHPELLSLGIGDVYVEAYNSPIYLYYKSIQTKSIDNEKAKMILSVGFEEIDSQDYNLKLIVLDKDGRKTRDGLSFSFNKNDLDDNLILSNSLIINKPKLWHPIGMDGEQYLYNAELEIREKNGDKPFVKESIRFGIRTIDLVQEKDSIGQSFYFRVNGKPIFAKGSNYIIRENQDIEELKLAVEANMNMLRIWGGSRYGSDEFYNYCDSVGLLVWQDFPFACALYPADSIFLQSIEKEFKQNIKRLASHPSLALWCGNNENWEGWMNWGWKSEIRDSAKAVENYRKVFQGLIPSVLAEIMPYTDYIHTSPLHGWGREESRTDGDSHYWGVWWADSCFEVYTRKIPRFMSEYGFQSPPTLKTIDEYMPKPYSPDNKAFAIHQKHPRGFELIESRLLEWYGKPSSDEDYIEKSGMTAQEAYKIAIEAHRRAMPYCMGTLFWQHNEPYPAVSWSCIDYNNNPKPVYYTIQKAYERLIFSIDQYSSSDSLYIYISNDQYRSHTLDYSVEIRNNKDEVKYITGITQTTIPEFTSHIIHKIALNSIPYFNPRTDYLWIQGKTNTSIQLSNYAFFVYPKDYIDYQKYIEVRNRYMLSE